MLRSGHAGRATGTVRFIRSTASPLRNWNTVAAGEQGSNAPAGEFAFTALSVTRIAATFN
jgi:hypothetical protein